jgi:hypothetical protein
VRTLSSALNAAYGTVVQKPAWLIRIDLTSPIYLSSHTTVTWQSQVYTAADVDVSSLRVGALAISGALVFGNADDVYGGIALGEGFSDKWIRIMGYDASIASPGAGDPVLVCDAIGGGCEISEREVRLTLRDECEYRLGPRAIVAPEFGFNILLQAGRTITINGVNFTIQRGR